jgi:glycosyltransferase involved in cell wall biosynthesis
VSHADKVDLLWRSHVLVNASPKEGWGLTVLEANACGVPVVASRRPGLVDSVRHRETGILVPYGDAAAFASAILELLRDPALYAACASRGRAWAEGFTWPAAAVQTERVLARALEAAVAPPASGPGRKPESGAAAGLASPRGRH